MSLTQAGDARAELRERVCRSGEGMSRARACIYKNVTFQSRDSAVADRCALPIAHFWGVRAKRGSPRLLAQVGKQCARLLNEPTGLAVLEILKQDKVGHICPLREGKKPPIGRCYRHPDPGSLWIHLVQDVELAARVNRDQCER